jgi:hypothetical protein
MQRLGSRPDCRGFGSVGNIETNPLSLFLSLLFPEGIATQSDPVRVMNDAVQNGVGEGGITDQVVPSFERDLPGDQRGTTTVPLLLSGLCVRFS